jgi:eukaryotic-like serine/threonine-protein kinase
MLGKYQLIAEIARGGMGVVYLAMVQGPGGFNKLVVVKELKPELVEEPAFLTMFLDEARLAARLNHPNIVQTNEVGNDGDRYFMAMDYLDGRGLDQVRRRTKVAGFGLSVSMQIRVICDMLSGLEYAHNLTDFDGSPLHIVHRDVSPQNVFITFDGQVKLLDFGIAKASDSMHETHAGVVKGKVSYMSPEQGRGQKVDARADVFSAGVLLWEALTGKRMREGKNDQEKLWALVSADVPRASTVRPSVPPELDRICAQAMAWNRDERYATAGAMQHDLERYLTATGTNVSAREVGGCVTELFREDRANTNGVIEAHVARARGGAVREKLPIIDVASRLGIGSPTPSNERHATHPPTEVGQATSLDVPSAKLASTTPSVLSGEPQRITRTGTPRGLLIPGVAIAAVAAVIIFFVARSSQEAGQGARADNGPHVTMPAAPPPVASPPVVPLPVASPPVAPPLPTTRPSDPSAPAVKPSIVDVGIRVSPETARVSIDGTDVGGGSFTRQYAIDDVIHSIRVVAPGYVTKSVTVPFTANITLDLSLERALQASPSRPVAKVTPPVRTPPVRTADPRPVEPAHPPDPATGRPPVDPTTTVIPKPAQPTDVDPAGGSKPRRPIDPNNPYGGRE